MAEKKVKAKDSAVEALPTQEEINKQVASLPTLEDASKAVEALPTPEDAAKKAAEASPVASSSRGRLKEDLRKKIWTLLQSGKSVAEIHKETGRSEDIIKKVEASKGEKFTYEKSDKSSENSSKGLGAKERVRNLIKTEIATAKKNVENLKAELEEAQGELKELEEIEAAL